LSGGSGETSQKEYPKLGGGEFLYRIKEKKKVGRVVALCTRKGIIAAVAGKSQSTTPLSNPLKRIFIPKKSRRKRYSFQMIKHLRKVWSGEGSEGRYWGRKKPEPIFQCRLISFRSARVVSYRACGKWGVRATRGKKNKTHNNG